MKYRSRKRLARAAAGAALFGCLVSSNRAQAEPRDPAAAQALFDQARELIRQHRYGEACPKLLESNRLDPGIGTQFHLAECYEQSGQIATAWATFLDVASQARAAGQAEREKAAAKRAAALESRLPKLTINVPEASQVPGLEIRRDSLLVNSVQWGSPVPVDPGEHQLSVTAAGRHPFSQSLKAEEGKPIVFEVPRLEIDEEEETSPPAVKSTAISHSGVNSAEPIAPPHKHRRRPETESRPESAPEKSESHSEALPLVLAGAGVVGLAVGTGFAFKASSDNTKSKQNCAATNPNLCDATGVTERNDARAAGNIATVGFIGGAALLASATLIWVLEDHRKSEKSASAPIMLRAGAAVLPGNAAVYLNGDF